MDPTPIIRCQEVRRHFGEGDARVEALRGVDLDVPAGELTFLVGPSGCGKTTLISVMAGLLRPSSGTVTLLGRNPAALDEDALTLFRRQHLGFVFQQSNLLPALTAVENAAIPLLTAGMPRRPATDRAGALLDRLGLGHRLRAHPRELSGGQQQRVALARALVHEPRVVICDEPTAALDHAAGEAVMQLLADQAVHPDRAVIVVTHDTRVFRFAHTLAHMNDGLITHFEDARNACAAHP